MSENHPKSPSPRLGTPQIKTGARWPTDQADQPAEPAEAAEAALPTRRSLRQHRRADSEAGTPAGKASRPAILELPATIISPSDVGPLTGQLPTGISPTRGGTDRGDAVQSGASPDPTVRVDHDGVPVGPDGHPLTRRELRAWRRRQEEASEGVPSEPSDVPATPAAAGPQPASRRAEAPAGSPGTVAAASAPAGGSTPADGSTSTEVPTRESLAAEGAALAARIEESGGADPSAVDPVLLREQELLAERARQLNTGLIARVPVAAPAPAPAGDSTRVPGVSAAPAAPAVPAAAQEPVQARSAHGLDSLGASAWSSRERNLILAAGLVIAALLIALILALVL